MKERSYFSTAYYDRKLQKAANQLALLLTREDVDKAEVAAARRVLWDAQEFTEFAHRREFIKTTSQAIREVVAKHGHDYALDERTGRWCHVHAWEPEVAVIMATLPGEDSIFIIHALPYHFISKTTTGAELQKVVELQ